MLPTGFGAQGSYIWAGAKVVPSGRTRAQKDDAAGLASTGRGRGAVWRFWRCGWDVCCGELMASGAAGDFNAALPTASGRGGRRQRGGLHGE